MNEELNKVELEKFDKNTNTVEFILNNEGHTTASLITERLENMSTFSAYKIMHPTDKFVKIKVEAEENPFNVIKKCVKWIIKDLDEVIETLRE